MVPGAVPTKNLFYVIMGVCLSRNLDVVEDYTSRKVGASPDSVSQDGRSPSMYNLPAKKTADINQSLTFTSQLSHKSYVKTQPSILSLYIESVARSCNGLPTTPYDDPVHSTVHGISVATYHSKSKAFIPSDVRIITLTPEDNVQGTRLSNKSSRVLANGFLKVLNDNRTKAISFAELVNGMDFFVQSEASSRTKYSLERQMCVKITSSESDLDVAFHIVRPAALGTRRAILIGSDNDSLCSVMTYLVEDQEFLVKDIIVLQNQEKDIVKQRLMALVDECKKGDTVFCYFEGAPDLSEMDLVVSFIGPMPAGITVTCLIEASHDEVELPFVYKSNGLDDSAPCMVLNDNFSFLRSVINLKKRCDEYSSQGLFLKEIEVFTSFIEATRSNIDARKRLQF